MAILAASLFLAFAARTGADFNGAHSQRARYSQAGKTGVGNNDYPCYRAVATGKRYAAFSIAALWLAMQQILIGIALGFTMQFAFAAVRTAGEFIGLQMGLSFATFVDPGSHLNMPVLARIMDMLAMLLFLTFNGHLWLISLLVDTFHTLPIGSNPVNSNAFMALARAGGLIFLNGTDAGIAGHYPPAYAQPGAGAIKPHGAAALDICYRFPAYPHRRHYADGRANAINCAVLRTFIQRNFQFAC